MKKTAFLAALFLLFSCKAKMVAIKTEAKDAFPYEKIISNHYNNKLEFSSLYIKANAKYKDEKQAQSVTAEIKIKKNEKILVSVRFLGFTVAKALITPTQVKYYDKVGSKFFEGDFQTLSKWLGTDLNYDKLQNLFLGKPIDDLTKQKFVVTIQDKLFQLANSDAQTSKLFLFEADNFLLKKQTLAEVVQKRSLEISYPEYQKVNEILLPSSLQIDANSDNKTTQIQIDYRNFSMNEELNFPYNVPDGYEQIFIK